MEDRRAAARSRLPLLALVLVPVMFQVAIVATRHVRLALVPRFGALFKLGFVLASALAHWSIYGGLLVVFALTLRPGHEPLITAIARRMHGSMPEELATYTRRVTIAWCCFFAAQLATSITLFVFAPLVVWSFFVNILDLPLVLGMFAAEYMVRRSCLDDPPRHSLSAILNMIADVRADVRKTRTGTAGVR
jgi:uncharacterized membrane protein